MPLEEIRHLQGGCISLNSLFEHGSGLKSKSLNWAVKITSFLLSTLRAHTHLFFYLFSSNYSDSLASSFPPSDDLLHCLLATQFNSRQLFLIHCVPGTELRVIRSQSHLGAESSWILHSISHKILITKSHQFYPWNATPVFPDLPPYCPPMVLVSLFLAQKNAAASCVFGPPLSVHFHTKAVRSDREVIMQRPSMVPHYLQKTASTLDSSTSLAPHYLCTSKFPGFLPSPFPLSYFPLTIIVLIHYCVLSI